MLNFITKIFGNKNERDLKPLWPVVDQVNSVGEQLKSISNDELRAKTTEFKKRINEYVAGEKNKILKNTATWKYLLPKPIKILLPRKAI